MACTQTLSTPVSYGYDDLCLELENGHSRPPCVQQFRVPLRKWDSVNEHINSW